MRSKPSFPARAAAASALAASLLFAPAAFLGAHAQPIGAASQTSVATPHVLGPIPVTTTPGAGITRDYPFFAAAPQFDLARAGYVEEEFFIQGTASRFQTSPTANGVELSSGHPYKTRIVVRRPVDKARFNGVVLVEWANVSSGYAIDLHWQYSQDHLVRQGYVFVRVDAQRVGVHQPNTGLRDWSPTRYGSLDVTAGGTVMDDSLSYDIFSQAAKALKGSTREQLLGSLVPKVVLAVGQSQSALRLTSYYNSIQPLHKVVDGFLVQVSGGPFRSDVPAPMIRVLSENEVRGSQAAIRQPDSATLRSWEIAGAAHVDYWWVQTRQAVAVRDGMAPPNLKCTPEPASHVPLQYVLNAGYHHLAKWAMNRIEPPSAPYIELSSLNPVVIPRDGNGIAYGGIRQHEVEVPTATNRGDQPGMTPGCPNSYGMHVPFSDQKLQQLYYSKDAYVRAVANAVKNNVQQGFILHDDGQEIIERAKSSNVGTGRPVSIH